MLKKMAVVKDNSALISYIYYNKDGIVIGCEKDIPELADWIKKTKNTDMIALSVTPKEKNNPGIAGDSQVVKNNPGIA